MVLEQEEFSKELHKFALLAECTTSVDVKLVELAPTMDLALLSDANKGLAIHNLAKQLWTKAMNKGTKCAAWSPDSRLVLILDESGQVYNWGALSWRC